LTVLILSFDIMKDCLFCRDIDTDYFKNLLKRSGMVSFLRYCLAEGASEHRLSELHLGGVDMMMAGW
jgi:hypothetical protein